jgi:mannose-6-phosphate isomerase-like protein (cupin superfamily)
MQAHAGRDEIYYVIAGQGQLRHSSTPGSPVVARPLRPGDAVLVRGGEYHSVANLSAAEELRLIVLGLQKVKFLFNAESLRGRAAEKTL